MLALRKNAAMKSPSARDSQRPWSLSLRARNCPICDSAAAKVFAEGRVDLEQLDGFAFASRKLPEYMHWRLLECRGCDLLYASPAPEAGELASLYRQADFGSACEARYAARTYGGLLPRLTPRLPDLDQALDVGCGEGAFLQELLRCGFRSVVGLEPSSAAIAAADPAVRPLIRETLFQPGLFPPGSVSLATCFQTIEHVSDPLQLCRELFALLKPGAAVMLVAHNRRALSAKALGRKSPIFDIEHLQLFSPSSLERLLEVAGFRQIRVRSLWNCYPARYWLRLFPLPRGLKRAAGRLLDGTGLGRLPVSLPAGNLVAVAWK